MKIAAFARSAAECALKEILPNFVPGFSEKLEYFMKESDLGDGNEIRYFKKFTSMYVYGFYLDKEIVTEELLEEIKSDWISRDKYWEHRPTKVIAIDLWNMSFPPPSYPWVVFPQINLLLFMWTSNTEI